MDRDYVTRNEHTRERLQALVGRLTPEDLDRSIGDGWTVKAALAHLAYWDRYAVALIDQWSDSGFKEDEGFSSDFPNLAGLADWLAAPPDYARATVIAAAQLADQRATEVPPQLVDAIIGGDMPRVLDRSVHRIEHIDQVERFLST
ncbi:MAG: maleylpyruvate isomerase N-terminal domain-containing protein [Dehalococcoidia bacterium]